MHLCDKEQLQPQPQPKATEPTRHNSIPDVIVEDYDEKSEVQARIWNLFVRKGVTNDYILKRVDRDADYRGGLLVTPDVIKSLTTLDDENEVRANNSLLNA